MRNEDERIAACLRAIDAQEGLADGSLGLVLFLNNCTDDTQAIVSALVPALSIPVRVLTEDFSGAHAGWARRRAMDAAAAWLGDVGNAGIILSTDADSRVPPDWVFRNRAAIRQGLMPLRAGSNSIRPKRPFCRPRSRPGAAWRISTTP